MVSDKRLNEIKKKIEPVFKKYPISYAGVFGSFARGEEKSESDIDIMIRLKQNSAFSLFDLIGVERELEEKVGRKVDLATEKNIGRYIKSSVFNDLKPIYED
ncbi:MAG: nucleotidyltransferase family protein [Patescibacteria group bacterium]